MDVRQIGTWRGERVRAKTEHRAEVYTRGYTASGPNNTKELLMADKSPKKSSTKTAAAKTLKEKRADKQVKAAAKRKD